MNWKLIRIIDTWLGIPLLLLFYLQKLLRIPQSSSEMTTIKRILLIKFWGIGNIFMLLPAIRSLRLTYPDATIDFLTLESNREALTATNSVNSIATINTKSVLLFIRTWMCAVSDLKKNRYDVIIDFEQFARFSALIAHQINAPESIGFETRGQHRSLLFTRALPYNNSTHVTGSFTALAAYAAGTAAQTTRDTGLIVHTELRSQGRALLVENGVAPHEICVVMHIGTSDNFRERRWLPKRYAGLADELVEAFQVRVIFTGLRDEAFLVRETISHVRFRSAMLDLSGTLPFIDYFAIIANADLVISADTAAVHLASAANIPVVGLYGPNTPTLYGPWGVCGLAMYRQFECSPCITNFNAKLHTCRHPDGRGACMQAITVADTFREIRRNYFDPGAPCRLEKLGANA